MFRVFVENKLAVVGAVVIILMVLFCFVGPVFYSTNQTNAQLRSLNSVENARAERRAPSRHRPNGFDMLGRIMYGGQTRSRSASRRRLSPRSSASCTGAISGFFGGWVDTMMMRIVDVLLVDPTVVLADRPRGDLPVLARGLDLVIGFTAWLVPARLVRGETLMLRVREYVQAVHVMGGSSGRIVFRHIVPNTIGTIIVNATFQVADAILYPRRARFHRPWRPSPQTDWGSMLSDGVSYAVDGYWWEIYPAGVASCSWSSLQLRRRRAARRIRGPAAASLRCDRRVGFASTPQGCVELLAGRVTHL